MGAGHRDQPDGVDAALPGRAARHDEGALGPDRERDLGRGATGNPGQGNYAASKAGLVGMSKSLAYEVASRGITVNCIAPGFIETAMTDKLTDDQKEKILGQIPAWGRPTRWARPRRPMRSRRRHSCIWPAPRRAYVDRLSWTTLHSLSRASGTKPAGWRCCPLRRQRLGEDDTHVTGQGIRAALQDFERRPLHVDPEGLSSAAIAFANNYAIGGADLVRGACQPAGPGHVDRRARRAGAYLSAGQAKDQTGVARNGDARQETRNST
jgi:hypothetical protein